MARDGTDTMSVILLDVSILLAGYYNGSVFAELREVFFFLFCNIIS